ncbi:MAG: response regulator [Desulfobacterales bacterium]|nr:response regulator [Desulfobacterales bacterium]
MKISFPKPSDRRILLVDDEDSIRKVLSFSLSDIGYQVIPAANGIEALSLFLKLSPPIVLTDIKMPGMTGVELLSKIKEVSPETEVIMISGHGDMALAIESLKHDATDFITKPINDDALEIALKRANERIEMRYQIHTHTENLEKLVAEQSAKLVEVERITAVSKTYEGVSSALWQIAGDFNGAIRHFNEMPCLVSVHSTDMSILSTNRLYKDRLGDKTGDGSWEVYLGRACSRDTCPVGLTVITGKSQRSKETLRYINGTEKPVLVHTAPIRNNDGKIELVIEITTDMAEIQQLQLELESTRHTYQQLFDEVPCYITVQDDEFRIMAANRQFKEDFEHIPGANCHYIYKQRSTPCPDCPVQKTFKDGESHQSEMVVTARNGEQYNVLVSTAPIYDTNGKITQVIEMSTNITQIRELQDHLTTLGLKISSISHGVKGLLTGLDSGIYTLDSGLKKNDQERILEGWSVVKQQVGHIRSLILDILYLTKERTLQLEHIDILKFTRDVSAVAERKMKTNNILYERQVAPDLGSFEIDPAVVRLAIINILENALDACLENSPELEKSVSLHVDREKDNIVFSITDTGIGMDSEAQKKLFTLFYSSKGHKGTGLGLYITKKIIEQHGGEITVRSEKGHGSSFKIKIPKILPEEVKAETIDLTKIDN